MNEAEQLFDAMANIENRILEEVNRDDPDTDYSAIEPLSQELTSLLNRLNALQIDNEQQRQELRDMAIQLRQHLQERVASIAVLQKQIRRELLKTTKGVKGTHAYQQMLGNPKKK